MTWRVAWLHLEQCSHFLSLNLFVHQFVNSCELGLSPCFFTWKGLNIIFLCSNSEFSLFKCSRLCLVLQQAAMEVIWSKLKRKNSAPSVTECRLRSARSFYWSTFNDAWIFPSVDCSDSPDVCVWRTELAIKRVMKQVWSWTAEYPEIHRALSFGVDGIFAGSACFESPETG